MKVLVFGAGSLGSLVGGLLARTHDVTLVGRDPHVSAVDADGLRIEGAVEASVSPAADTDVPGDPFDLALVTVKAGDTDAAAAALSDATVGVACSLQNGLGNEERLAARLSAPVLAGTCTYGARLTEPGVVECTGVGEIAVGPREGGESAAADEVGAAFDAAGLETTVATDMPRRLWAKLAVNAGINPVTALARVPNGVLVDGPAQAGAADGASGETADGATGGTADSSGETADSSSEETDSAEGTADSASGESVRPAVGETAREAARETARVARATGIDLDEAAAAERVTRVAGTTAANTSSMYQDVAAGRRTEIDAINWAVVERAETPVPVNETLTALVRAWERERDLR